MLSDDPVDLRGHGGGRLGANLYERLASVDEGLRIFVLSVSNRAFRQ